MSIAKLCTHRGSKGVCVNEKASGWETKNLVSKLIESVWVSKECIERDLYLPHAERRWFWDCKVLHPGPSAP